MRIHYGVNRDSRRGDATMTTLLDDAAVVRRIFDHIDHRTTDVGEGVWREPVEHYRSPDRFAAEQALLRARTIAFCPSAALPEPGAFVAREAAGTPLVAVRGGDGVVRAFRNACRHRGARVADGSGCAKAFVCRYHGWTYGLDGALRHVPHEHGFPGLDHATRGLVPVATSERHGLVFVTQDGPEDAASLAALPPLIPPRRRLVQESVGELPVNWKIFVESFLEGYHIRSTHRDTFYAVQYDNLNVVERFGPNSRITFPYRAVEKLRALPPEAWSVDTKLTYVYHLFPNVMVATFPSFVFMVAIEPLAVDRTRAHTYITAAADAPAEMSSHSDAVDASDARATAGAALIAAGAAEDNAAVRAIQDGLASGANAFLEFGRFETAIQHFHRGMHAALAARGTASAPAP
jgi:phenylpropionate dioxygenase-like ring-hydroxylating dioxygenase large terminal subunit